MNLVIISEIIFFLCDLLYFIIILNISYDYFVLFGGSKYNNPISDILIDMSNLISVDKILPFLNSKIESIKLNKLAKKKMKASILFLDLLLNMSINHLNLYNYWNKLFKFKNK